jgi:hypothetical protein
MLSVIMLGVIMPSVIILSIIMPSVIMPSVIILSVRAPFRPPNNDILIRISQTGKTTDMMTFKRNVFSFFFWRREVSGFEPPTTGLVVYGSTAVLLPMDP